MSANSLKFSLLSCFASLLAFQAFFTTHNVTAQRGVASRKTDSFTYGGGPEGIRYSGIKQINRENVAQLQVAWTYDTADGPGDTQTQPIVVDGALYGVTAKHKIIALDAATGKLLWRFDSGLAGRGPNRGVTYWANGKDQRIFAAVQSYVYALDATTGKPIPSFGQDGRIDLREGLGRDPQKISIVLTTPGIVYKDLLIVGGRTPESLPAPPGDIRAYDVRSGKLRWSFHTIPRPGEYGYNTWPKDAWKYTGSANNWVGMARANAAIPAEESTWRLRFLKTLCEASNRKPGASESALARRLEFSLC
jgi:quinoprotein glucose dehydrogenase